MMRTTADMVMCEVPGLSPASLQRTAVPTMDTAEETAQAPRISGACRTMSRRWSNILKAKERMMTPKKLIRKSPAPYSPAPWGRMYSVVRRRPGADASLLSQ